MGVWLPPVIYFFKESMKKLVLIIVLIVALNSFAFAEFVVTLEWSPNTETDLAGYKVFVHVETQNYNYTTPAWQGTETTCQVTVPTTDNYYFVARAFDTEGFESLNSNEVIFYGKPTAPGNLRIIN